MTDYGIFCTECKAGTPVRFRADTQEWVHENIRTDEVKRSSSHSMCYCTATPQRIKDNQNG